MCSEHSSAPRVPFFIHQISTCIDRVIQPVITRRNFLKQSTIFAAGAYLNGQLPPAMRHHPIAKQQVAFDTSKLEKFVDPLPIPAIAQAQGKRPSPEDQRMMVPYYRMSLRQTDIKVHRDMKPTSWWACASSVPGATIEARSGEPLFIEWANELPQQHFLPIDHNLHGAEADKPQVRTVVHVHGAKVPPNMTGTRRTGWYRANRICSTTRTSRTRRCCGITTTPWA